MDAACEFVSLPFFRYEAAPSRWVSTRQHFMGRATSSLLAAGAVCWTGGCRLLRCGAVVTPITVEKDDDAVSV